jgi:hypothetical protein
MSSASVVFCAGVRAMAPAKIVTLITENWELGS